METMNEDAGKDDCCLEIFEDETRKAKGLVALSI